MTKQQLLNWIGGEQCSMENPQWLDVACPATGEVFAEVLLSGEKEVDQAVAAAAAAHQKWSGLTTKSRALVLHRLYELIRDHTDELVEAIMKEHGKNRPEAQAEVAKGNETVEFACAFPVVARGGLLEVSRGVHCHDVREPLGVVAHIVPFNFPAMVPLWTIPIALAAGNTVVLKPSEKVPLTMNIMARLFNEAGFPKGAFNIVNGAKDVVTAICKHPGIEAVSFVGSSPVAKLVTTMCHETGKRVLAMGGAKNHLIALPDCELESTAVDIVGSFTGCTGQRCMAASVLVIVDQSEEDRSFGDRLLQAVCDKAAALKAGQEAGDVGPVIDQAAVDRVARYIEGTGQRGGEVLVDGRKWAHPDKGFWIGPTVVVFPKGTGPEEPSIRDEVFGPMLSVVRVTSRSEALALEHASPYGNAACVYTSSGANAEWFSKRFSAAMIGVNIGVPVPREPFSFGGMGASKFGNHGDVTGQGAVEFFTRLRKVTTRWPVAGRSDNLPWFR